MSEIWIAAVVGIGGSMISGMGEEKKDAANKEHDTKMTKEGARWSSAASAFEAEQTDYYSQLNRQRKQRGLDNFRQFSQVSNFAPQYQQGAGEITVGDKPSVDAYFGPEYKGPGSSGGGMSRALDPLGIF